MRVIAFAVAGVLGMAAPALAASGDIERARARVLTPEYQTEMPGDAGSGAALERRRDRRMVPREDDALDTREHRATTGVGALGSLINILMWGMLIVAIALCAFWLVAELLKYTENAEVSPDDVRADESAALVAAVLDRPLGDADELARRGELSEAIHTLLLRTLQELVRSASVRVERSHTSREILARVPLLGDAREALADLITAVELTHFGDEPATAADYERCRRQFHRFAEAFRASLARGAPRHAGAAA